MLKLNKHALFTYSLCKFILKTYFIPFKKYGMIIKINEKNT